MEDIKIWVGGDPDLIARIMTKLDSEGVIWSDGERLLEWTPQAWVGYLTVRNNLVSYGVSIDSFRRNRLSEVSPEEFLQEGLLQSEFDEAEFFAMLG